MAYNTWVQTLIASTGDGSALSNSTSPTSIIPTGAKFVLPANYLQVGSMLRVKASGRISNIVTTPGTITFSIRWGSGPVIVATSDALQMNAVAKTNTAWYLEWLLTCRAIGGSTSANLIHTGIWASESVVASPLASAGGQGFLALQNSAPAVGTGFDSTAAQIMDLFATFSIANANNAITCHQYSVEAMN